MGMPKGRFAVVAGIVVLGSSVAVVGAGAKQVSLAKGVRVTFPADWPPRSRGKARWSADHGPAKAQPDASMQVEVETRADHAEALARLGAVEAEYPDPVNASLIGGWPAVERNISIKLERPGEGGGGKSGPIPGDRARLVTTAIAVKNLFVRFDTLLQPNATAALADQALAIARQISLPAAPASSTEELRALQAGAHRLAPLPPPKLFAPKPISPRKAPRRLPRGPGPIAPGAGTPIGGAGEIEVAVSGDGSALLVDADCILSASSDFGASFKGTTVVTGGIELDGDCSVTWGASGAFYLTWLGVADHVWQGAHVINAFSSTDGGMTFNAVSRPVKRDSLFDIVDQPHIAADRFNLSKQGKDMIYVVWQEGYNLDPFLRCSRDGGANWDTSQAVYGGHISYPRVSVGGDGMVYVLARTGNVVNIDKFSSCDGGLARQAHFPVQVVIHPVTCPIAGLDRCNNGNWLSSPTIAVDDTNPRHVYLGWAESNGPGEDIVVTDSTDGGQTFGPTVAVNGNLTIKNHRFLPWLTTWRGVVHAGWYDRTNATTSHPDFTRYFRGSASVVAGVLTPGPEFDLSGFDDPQCKSGFPNGARDQSDCEACRMIDPSVSCGTNYFGGTPKFGDYNGVAAGGGRLINAWASSTGPRGTFLGGISPFTTVTDLCGASGQGCCPAGPACGAGLVCDSTKTCLPCGTKGKLCCDGKQCGGTLLCSGSICVCGEAGWPCCDDGPSCIVGMACNDQHQCEACGGGDQLCCDPAQGPVCNVVGSTCDPGSRRCVAQCGTRNHQCCNGSTCNAGLTCAGGTCTCGGPNQACCLTGNRCNGTLTCASGHCVSSTDPCATCASDKSHCYTNCGTKADCRRICDSTFCTCETTNGCGPCEF
jgi:hypothetical protein